LDLLSIVETWLHSAFIFVLPFEVVLRLFDLYFHVGVRVFIWTAVCLLGINSARLLQCTSSTTLMPALQQVLRSLISPDFLIEFLYANMSFFDSPLTTTFSQILQVQQQKYHLQRQRQQVSISNAPPPAPLSSSQRLANKLAGFFKSNHDPPAIAHYQNSSAPMLAHNSAPNNSSWLDMFGTTSIQSDTESVYSYLGHTLLAASHLLNRSFSCLLTLNQGRQQQHVQLSLGGGMEASIRVEILISGMEAQKLFGQVLVFVSGAKSVPLRSVWLRLEGTDIGLTSINKFLDRVVQLNRKPINAEIGTHSFAFRSDLYCATDFLSLSGCPSQNEPSGASTGSGTFYKISTWIEKASDPISKTPHASQSSCDHFSRTSSTFQLVGQRHLDAIAFSPSSTALKRTSVAYNGQLFMTGFLEKNEFTTGETMRLTFQLANFCPDKQVHAVQVMMRKKYKRRGGGNTRFGAASGSSFGSTTYIPSSPTSMLSEQKPGDDEDCFWEEFLFEHETIPARSIYSRQIQIPLTRRSQARTLSPSTSSSSSSTSSSLASSLLSSSLLALTGGGGSGHPTSPRFRGGGDKEMIDMPDSGSAGKLPHLHLPSNSSSAPPSQPQPLPPSGPRREKYVILIKPIIPFAEESVLKLPFKLRFGMDRKGRG
jgi:hypothetical protein